MHVRWAPQTTSLTFTGVEPGTASALVLPRRRPFNIIIYGDSITEGVRTMGYVGIPYDTVSGVRTRSSPASLAWVFVHQVHVRVNLSHASLCFAYHHGAPHPHPHPPTHPHRLFP